jgi:hypothetical protein
MYRMRLFVRKIRRMLRAPKYWYQRARYGYSDRDTWNMDMYLAGVIARMLEHQLNYGMTISINNDENLTYYQLLKKRDEEYAKYIAIFKEYSTNMIDFRIHWVQSDVDSVYDDSMGVSEEEINEALQWFSKNFMYFWD